MKTYKGVALALITGSLAACSVFEAPIEQGMNDGSMDAMATEDAASDGSTDAMMEAGTDAAVLPIPPRPTLTPCAYGTPMTTGTIMSATLDEVSGIAASRKNPRIVWMVEDSGAAAIVHAVNDLGVTVATYMFGGTNIDAEDMAIGPGPEVGADYLYVGDIGNNTGSRPTRTIYRAKEPTVAWNQSLTTGSLTGVEPLPFHFPAGLEDNAEALFVDPSNQDVYVITKNGFTRPNIVYRLAAPHQPAVSRELVMVASVYAGTGTDIAVTGADITPDGNRIIFRSLHSANLWTRGSGVSIADTFAGTPCEAVVPAAEMKGESVSFTATGYFTTSEGVAQALSFIPFVP